MSVLFEVTVDSSRVAQQPLTKLMPIRFQEVTEAVVGFERTGVALVSVRGDSLIPTASYDDVGIFYLVPKLATLFHLSPASAWDLFFFLMIIPTFTIGFIGMMRMLETHGARLFYAVMFAPLFITVYLSGDIYALSPALAVAIVPYVIQFSKSNSEPSMKHWILFFLFGMVIMLGHSIRAHSATAIVLTFSILFFLKKQWQMREKWISLIIIVIGILSIWLFFKARFVERNAYLSQQQPNYVVPPQAHPFWHNVYIGFGFLDNDYGIRYQDEIAFKKARTYAKRLKVSRFQEK